MLETLRHDKNQPNSLSFQFPRGIRGIVDSSWFRDHHCIHTKERSETHDSVASGHRVRSTSIIFGGFQVKIGEKALSSAKIDACIGVAPSLDGSSEGDILAIV